MIGFVFPGQGSQTVGMAQDLYEQAPMARALLEEMAAALDFPLLEIMFAGPEEKLTQTEYAQPALLAHSVSAHALLAAEGITAGLMAGHSLGEYSALVAADVLTPTAGAQLVRLRGRLMAEIGAKVGGTMAAVIGLGQEQLEEIVRQAQEEGTVVLANLNAPDQIVLSGELRAVKRAGELAAAAGAKRVIPLKVSGAFHSPLMAPAAAQLQKALAETPMQPARTPIVSNVDAQPRTEPEALRAALAEQLTAPVRWDDCLQAMATAGVTTFVEIGPGRVLTNMIRRRFPELTCYTVGDYESVRATIEALREA